MAEILDFEATFQFLLDIHHEEWGLPRVLLLERLNKPHIQILVTDLASLARDLYFKNHAGKGLDENEARFNLESFGRVALSTIAELQHQIAGRIKSRKAIGGHQICVGDDKTYVVWMPWSP